MSEAYSYSIEIYTAQKMKFSIKDFSSKCDQIHSKLRIWSQLLKKSLMENIIFLCSDICYFIWANHSQEVTRWSAQNDFFEVFLTTSTS